MFVCVCLCAFVDISRRRDTGSRYGIVIRGWRGRGGWWEMVHIRHTSPGRPRGISDRKYLAVARVFYLGTAD